MGWKYRKRIKILPGFTLNFSKSGMSATVGVKGFSVNMGQKGTYLNTGIPGTGIYDRVRLDNQPSEKTNSKNIDSPNNQIPIEHEVVEIKSLQPELLTSDGLFGLKESIIKAQEIKQELKEDAEKTVSKRKTALFLAIITHMLIFGIFIKWFRENYKTCKADAEEADNAYKNFKLDIDFNMDQSILNEYIILKNNFDKLTSCQKIWSITSTQSVDRAKTRSAASTSITRIPVNFSMGTLNYINTKYDAFKFKNANGGDLYIYPGFIVMPSEHSNDFAIIDFRDITLEHNGQRFLEQETVPSDAKIVDRTWQYVNKNGMPDKRYSYNPEIPIALYYELVLKTSKGLYESFGFSNSDTGEKFCVAFENYQLLLNSLKWDKEQNKLEQS